MPKTCDTGSPAPGMRGRAPQRLARLCSRKLRRAIPRRSGTTQTLFRQGLGAHHIGELTRLHRGRKLQLPVQQRLVARLALHHLPWHLRPVFKLSVSMGVQAFCSWHGAKTAAGPVHISDTGKGRMSASSDRLTQQAASSLARPPAWCSLGEARAPAATWTAWRSGAARWRC